MGGPAEDSPVRDVVPGRPLRAGAPISDTSSTSPFWWPLEAVPRLYASAPTTAARRRSRFEFPLVSRMGPRFEFEGRGEVAPPEGPMVTYD